MKTLLIHALNPEAHLIKRQFPEAEHLLSIPGMDLIQLDEYFDILRTGIGLTRAASALSQIPDPDIYSSFIQFGVSGSLSQDLPVKTLICAHSFSAQDQVDIIADSSGHSDLPGLVPVKFFSSVEVVSDEASREMASARGAQAVDMESYAAAQFCAQHGLPLKTLRIISDRAGDSTPAEFKKNFKRASHILQHYLIEHIL